MQSFAYLRGERLGRIAKTIVINLHNLRQQMLLRVGKSKKKIFIANSLFFLILSFLVLLLSFVFYFFMGIIGPVLFLISLIALPKAYIQFREVNDEEYVFNDGYRDGPEGYGYYSGGYKVDD